MDQAKGRRGNSRLDPRIQHLLHQRCLAYRDTYLIEKMYRSGYSIGDWLTKDDKNPHFTPNLEEAMKNLVRFHNELMGKERETIEGCTESEELQRYVCELKGRAA